MSKHGRVIVLFFLGLLGMAFVESSVIWLIHRVTDIPVWHSVWINNLIGVSLVISGAALVIWSVRIQYREGKGTPAPMVATQKLVVSGPYAYTRNPMTLGAALFYLGIAIWLGSLPGVGLVVLVFAALLSYIAMHETAELTERFGEEYLAYRQRTPFLLPRFKK
jgi:protein-S-isoprenylcysteine O-methyltransferase Ste14